MFSAQKEPRLLKKNHGYSIGYDFVHAESLIPSALADIHNSELFFPQFRFLSKKWWIIPILLAISSSVFYK